MYEVIKTFIDKETRDKFLIGAEYEVNSAERGKKLVSLGFLKESKKSKVKKGADEK